MIWHFLEVWFLFLLVFGFGCGLGAFVYAGLAVGPLAGVQSALANLVGDGIDEVKWRLGVGPDWRAGFRPSVEWPRPNSVQEDFPDDPRPATAPEPPVLSDEPQLQIDEQLNKPGPDDEAVAADEGGENADAAELAAVAGEATVSDDAISEDNALMRPAWLVEPRSSVPDNLQRISGIGKRNENLLNSLGIFHFGQIASWTPAEMRWVAANLAFPERIERDDWIGQAMVLASGGDPSEVNSTEDDE